MKSEDFIKLGFIVVALIIFSSLYLLSTWMDVPFVVKSKVIAMQLVTFALIGGAFALYLYQDISGWFFSPLIVMNSYIGFIPLMNYKSVPFYSEAIIHTPAYFGQMWFHGLMVFGILFIGYALIFYRQKMH